MLYSSVLNSFLQYGCLQTLVYLSKLCVSPAYLELLLHHLLDLVEPLGDHLFEVFVELPQLQSLALLVVLGHVLVQPHAVAFQLVRLAGSARATSPG